MTMVPDEMPQGFFIPVPGAKGDPGTPGAPGADSTVPGPPGAASTVPGPKGDKGDKGDPGASFIGQVTLAEGGLLSLRLANILQMEATLAGAVVGERYQPFCRSYKLNGGASTAGCPAGYTILDARCNTAGKVIVSYNAPALAIGASYELKIDIMKIP